MATTTVKERPKRPHAPRKTTKLRKSGHAANANGCTTWSWKEMTMKETKDESVRQHEVISQLCGLVQPMRAARHNTRYKDLLS